MIAQWLTGRRQTIDKELIDRGRKLKEMRDGSEAFQWLKTLIQENEKAAYEALVEKTLPNTESLSTLRGKVIALRDILAELDDEIEAGEKESIRYLESLK